ncbi:MAG: TlpA family protein disulfide reductase [Bacteroidia bacterium]|nr:TlpA family protein disulfide reductase [Bacteroidia bacterium]MDW8058087.1 TlpA disulfide reductase family protein [Bacteroidia bacterium]
MKRGLSVLLIAGLWGQVLPTRTWAEIERQLQSHPETLYVLNFWSTWCRPCIAELPHLQAAYERLAKQIPVSFWLISLDFPPDGAKKAARLLHQKGISLPAFWLSEKDPNTWIPRLHSDWDGAIPYTQAGLGGPFHDRPFSNSQEVEDFVRKAYDSLTSGRR